MDTEPDTDKEFIMQDLTNKRFGKLTVIEKGKDSNFDYWLCKCVCGKEIEILDKHLRQGTYKTCDCSRTENPVNLHGLKRTKIYKVWSMIKQRCNNPNNKDYKHYGLRGIKIYSEWENNVKVFYDWAIENGYKEGLTIDRIDVNGNYEPSNCRWITMKEQSRNKRTNVNLTFNGETHCVTEWYEKLNISKNAFKYRLKRFKAGLMTLEEVFKHKE